MGCQRVSPKRRRVLALLGWALLFVPARAQTVTFEVYPQDAVISYQAPSPAAGQAPGPPLEPLGFAGQPIDLSEKFDHRNILSVVVHTTDSSREPWKRTYTRHELSDGEKIPVFLHPRTWPYYLGDPVRYWPASFTVAVLASITAAGLAGWAGVTRLQVLRLRRAAQARAQVLEKVGAEYEREFGRWLIVGKLGSGGMGEVLKAFPRDSLALDSLVAIKMRAKFDEKRATQELKEREKEERARFAIETRVLCNLNHPGIVKVYDWGEIDGQDYYAMELVDGENLQSYLESHPRLSYAEVRDLFSQMLTVVGYAHRMGVLHRDLKPLNIIREPNGRLKVIDFGLARDQNRTVAYTQVGMPFAGSLEYMDPRVPQQMFSRTPPTPSDQGTDQFALGGILFLMLTGHPSIDLPDELDAQGLLPVLARIAEPRPSPRVFRPDLPEELEQVVMTMQAVKVEDRYSSLEEALEAFSAAIARYV
jgi:tRNA A-37 threonylcarbamoyl transferase component Bud32